jgi:cystinosin
LRKKREAELWQDLGGSILSFAQLVISSIFIEHDAGGIIANPAKLGLSGISLTFDIIFLLQRYYWFAEETKAEREAEQED